SLFAGHGETFRGALQPRKDGGLMEDPQDSFSSARHLLLEVMAEQEGCSLLDTVRIYNRNAEFKHRIDITAMNMTAAISYAIHQPFLVGSKEQLSTENTRTAMPGKGRPFQKGVSGNPGGRPRQDPEVRALCEKFTPAAIATLAEIMGNKKAQPSARVAAAMAILKKTLPDLASIEHTGDGPRPFAVIPQAQN